MSAQPPDYLPRSDYFIFLAMGIVGGIASYFDAMLHKKKKFSISEFILQFSFSGFFGYIGGIIFINLGYSQWAFVGAGIIGFMGSQAPKILISLVEKKLGITNE